LNDVQKGYRRDSRIVQGVTERKALTTEQVRCLYFRGMRYGLRKAQERLLRLVRHGRLRRTRAGAEYAYYVERQGQLDHVLAVNWCRLYVERNLLPQEKVTWTQPDYGFLRPDALAVVENTLTGCVYGIFVEADRSENPFDKAQLYARLYESGAYEGEEWASRVKAFPSVLVATDREALVKRAVRRDDTAGLKWAVMAWCDVRGIASGGRAGDKAGVPSGGGDGRGRVHAGVAPACVGQARHSGAHEDAGGGHAGGDAGESGVRRYRAGSGILRAATRVGGLVDKRGESVGED
jgi:hypothetical protein